MTTSSVLPLTYCRLKHFFYSLAYALCSAFTNTSALSYDFTSQGACGFKLLTDTVDTLPQRNGRRELKADGIAGLTRDTPLDQGLSKVPRYRSHYFCWYMQRRKHRFLAFTNVGTRQGFLTTFTLLARDSFTASQIWWMMINVSFG